MRFIFQPLSRAAVYLRKQCEQIADSMRRDGVQRRIVDGFIVEVLRRGKTRRAIIIDTDAYFVSTRANYQIGNQRLVWGFTRKQRADYMVEVPTKPQDVTIPDADSLQLYHVPYPSVLGVPPAVGTDVILWFPPQVRASVFRDRLCIGYVGLVGDGSQFSGYQTVHNIMIVSWVAKVGAFADYPAEVPPDSVPAWERVAVSDSGIRQLLGPEHFLEKDAAHLQSTGQIHGFSGCAAAGLWIEPINPEDPVRKAVVVLAPAYEVLERDVSNRARSYNLLLVALMVTASRPVPGATQATVPADWHVVLSSGPRAGVAGIGMASDGNVVSAVASVADRLLNEDDEQIGIRYSATHYWFTASGQQGSNLLYTQDVTAEASDAHCEVWISIGEASGAVFIAVLDSTVNGPTDVILTGTAGVAACKGGSVVRTSLPGWRPFTSVSRGTLSLFRSEPGLSDPVRSTVVADLGGDQIGLLAAPSAQLGGTSGTADWSLIVLSKETLALVAVRSIVVSMFWQQGSLAYAFQALSLTVVNQQVVNDEGEIVSPATLLVSVTETESLSYSLISTDGGLTWERIADLVLPGDVYYLGNRLHRVDIGKRL